MVEATLLLLFKTETSFIGGETEACLKNRTSSGPQVLLKLLQRTHMWTTLVSASVL